MIKETNREGAVRESRCERDPGMPERKALTAEKTTWSPALHPLKIGGVSLENNLVLAPMAGVSDLPFRLLCREMGAGLVCMEMVSAKAILYHNKNTKALLEIDPRERPVSLQLFGSDPEIMAEIAKQIEDLPFDILDINMGCPVPKVVNNGEGSALMKDPLLVGKIVNAVSSAIQKPVTVKIRKGFYEGDRTAPEIAHVAEESGAAAIAVHGRTREQYYRGKADWTIIRDVKEKVHSIPVLGNGDLLSGENIDQMYAETGCDGFLIARGAQGNPWIFRQMIHYLTTGKEEKRPDLQEMKAMMLRHARRMIEFKGEDIGMREMRKHAAWYTMGYRGASAFRREVNQVTSYRDLEKLLENI